MTDFPDDSSFDGLHSRKPSRRRRRPSFASQTSARSAGTSRPDQRERQYSSASVISHADSETDYTGLHSPVPRRHFLLQTESHQWLHAPLSPASSRPVSPLLTTYDERDSSSRHGTLKLRRKQTLSFSSLAKLDSKLVEEPEPIDNVDDTESSQVETSMGKMWIRWMHKNHLKNGVTLCSVLMAFCIKWCVGLGSYSGARTSPMFGDYEAQRHWMEITANLPLNKWYTYELQYWGLDYPPLTAYHSWICGLIGSWLDPRWFALDTSRGFESIESKLFMRSTVLTSELLVYIPALVFFVRTWHGNRSRRTQNMALLTLLLQPSLILIDNAHFQYNSVMLGLTLMALNLFSQGREELGAIFFVASLGFKQMSLYYAPAIGSFLLGQCISLGTRAGIAHLVRLGIITILSFYVIFSPFLPPFSPVQSVFEPIRRIFPFARGLFEDKVANMWCATNVILKWRFFFEQTTLIRLAGSFTALGFTPAVLNLIVGAWKASVGGTNIKNSDKSESPTPAPTLPILPWALLTSSMSFFLFSFQVHEKTILLPLLPLNLLMSGASPGTFTFDWGALVNNVAVFSMWPLLRRDGAAIPYIALTYLWNHMIGYNPFRKSTSRSFLRYFALLLYLSMATVHLLELILPPPARYPDLYPVLNVLLCTPVFGVTWLWSIKRSTEVTWGVIGLGLRTSNAPPREDTKTNSEIRT